MSVWFDDQSYLHVGGFVVERGVSVLRLETVGVESLWDELLCSTGTPSAPGRILAYGEATDHAHVVDGAAELFAPADLDEMEQRFLRVEEKARVVHDEHAAIVLEPGDYAVRRQREYAPKRPRFVAD